MAGSPATISASAAGYRCVPGTPPLPEMGGDSVTRDVAFVFSGKLPLHPVLLMGSCCCVVAKRAGDSGVPGVEEGNRVCG